MRDIGAIIGYVTTLVNRAHLHLFWLRRSTAVSAASSSTVPVRFRRTGGETPAPAFCSSLYKDAVQRYT